MKSKRSYWHIYFTYGGTHGNTKYALKRSGTLTQADIFKAEKWLSDYLDGVHGKEEERKVVIHSWKRMGCSL